MKLILELGVFKTAFFGVLAAVSFLTVQTYAAVVLYEIDPAQTTLLLRGKAGATNWQEQSAGSMMASFQGWLAIDLQATNIQLVLGSTLVGIQTNSYQPGTDFSLNQSPANYGVTATSGTGFSKVTEVAAVRNLQFIIAGPPIPNQSGAMNSSGLLFTIPTGGNSSLDYRVNGLVIVTGSKPLDGMTATNAGGPVTLSLEAEVQTITLPMDVSFTSPLPEAGETTLEFSGNLVARRGLTLITPQLLWIPSLTNHEEFTLVWGNPSRLQKATSLNPPNWTDYATNAPVTVSPSGTSAFFRVVP